MVPYRSVEGMEWSMIKIEPDCGRSESGDVVITAKNGKEYGGAVKPCAAMLSQSFTVAALSVMARN